jgi:hypothetical protein
MAAKKEKGASREKAAGPVRRNRETVQDRDRAAAEQLGASALAILFAFGQAFDESERLRKIERASRLFLIAVLFIAPVILMWRVAF